MITDRRSRIAVYEKQRVDDGQGGSVTNWVLWSALWAEVRLVSPRERFSSDGLQGAARFQAIIHHRDLFPDPARIVWGEHILRVIAASDPDGRRERLHLICEEELG